MKPTASFLDLYKQNNKLPIRVNTPSFGGLPDTVLKGYGLSHRKPNYFLLLMLQGTAQHGVDLQQCRVKGNDLLFIMPHQIHQLPLSKEGSDYYKLSFDETCLALLPKQFLFLLDPLNNQHINLAPTVVERLKAIFKILQDLLTSMDTDPALVLVYLGRLLTEIDTAYFATVKQPADDRLSAFIAFKIFIEQHYTDQPLVSDIAAKLALSVSSLHSIVKHYSGVSPKAFLTNRLMLEARRRIYYTEYTSVKELAYELGFNDPEYFSRLFKKTTGKTVHAFAGDLSGK